MSLSKSFIALNPVCFSYLMLIDMVTLRVLVMLEDCRLRLVFQIQFNVDT